MRWRSLCTLFLGVFLMSSVAWADDFYVIAGGRGVGTRISSLPHTISSPGFYYLSGNLTYSGSDNAITIEADDVTLDLMGFSLSNGGAPGSTNGIYLGGQHNVEIRNGTVCGFNIGVFGSSLGTKHRAINVRATGNNYGIYFSGSNHLIKSCNASNNNGGPGIHLSSGVITDCVASNNYIGIRVFGPGNVLGNEAFNNSTRNFQVGKGVATALMVDGNSAFGLNPNYFEASGTTGVQMGINAGTP